MGLTIDKKMADYLKLTMAFQPLFNKRNQNIIISIEDNFANSIDYFPQETTIFENEKHLAFYIHKMLLSKLNIYKEGELVATCNTNPFSAEIKVRVNEIFINGIIY